MNLIRTMDWFVKVGMPVFALVFFNQLTNDLVAFSALRSTYMRDDRGDRTGVRQAIICAYDGLLKT